ncbi:hypothetical protein SRHO_G00110190 [Serrasalmus rhombeus]
MDTSGGSRIISGVLRWESLHSGGWQCRISCVNRPAMGQPTIPQGSKWQPVSYCFILTRALKLKVGAIFRGCNEQQICTICYSPDALTVQDSHRSGGDRRS